MADTNNIIETLKIIPLFLDFNVDQLNRLSEITEVIELDPGDSPVVEGQPLDYLYIVIDGEMQIEVYVPSYGNMETSRLGTSGYLWLVRDDTSCATAHWHNNCCNPLQVDPHHGETTLFAL